MKRRILSLLLVLTLLLALLIAVYRMANRKVASRDRMDEVA